MSKALRYYVPHSSWWPFFGSVVMVVFVLGLISWLHNMNYAWLIVGLGVTGIATLMTGWFHDIMKESSAGLYSSQMHQTFRIGMMWFITSEIWFFAALFGALFYARWVSVPWLAGLDGYDLATKEFLYPSFQYQEWPLLNNPDPSQHPAALGRIAPWGLPLYNTIVLLLSAVTLTLAHHKILKDRYVASGLWLCITASLGVAFLVLQYHEYAHAIHELRLLLSSGIYASTFYMITGFHGLHVLIGTIFLIIVAIRTFRGHFTAHNHFAFESAAWYWHFVDTIWWAVFLFVYCV